MSQISKYLRDTTDNGLMFWCQGCAQAHRIQHGAGTGPRWTWNGDIEKPVFSPSVLVRSAGHSWMTEQDWADYDVIYAKGGSEAVFASKYGSICHTFVGCNGAQPGEIIFLSDCTHELAGKTVPLAEWPTKEIV